MVVEGPPPPPSEHRRGIAIPGLLAGPPIAPLPRNALASSATGGASGSSSLWGERGGWPWRKRHQGRDSDFPPPGPHLETAKGRAAALPPSWHCDSRPLGGAANRATSSKAARCIRHRRRFAAFPLETIPGVTDPAALTAQGAAAGVDAGTVQFTSERRCHAANLRHKGWMFCHGIAQLHEGQQVFAAPVSATPVFKEPTPYGCWLFFGAFSFGPCILCGNLPLFLRTKLVRFFHQL